MVINYLAIIDIMMVVFREQTLAIDVFHVILAKR
jgi:hypothetical protein